jgi:hypothetical protein
VTTTWLPLQRLRSSQAATAPEESRDNLDNVIKAKVLTQAVSTFCIQMAKKKEKRARRIGLSKIFAILKDNNNFIYIIKKSAVFSNNTA